MPQNKIRQLIRDIPDFPKPGIVFKDITPLLRDAEGLALTLDAMADQAKDLGAELIAGPESRGFIFGMGIAARLGLGFVPIRKPGKLPWKTRSATYELEYGSDQLEVHEDAFDEAQKVLIVDDLLATGGTMAACHHLVHEAGAIVAGTLVLIELGFLNGRDKLAGREVRSLLSY